jgi:uncharacterized cupin superfamily protein
VVGDVINCADVKAREVAEGDIRFERRTLGVAAGALRVGASLYVVPANARQMPVHVHGDEEEIFYVVGGCGLSWQRGEACEVTVGDTVVHRPSGLPHTFLAGGHGLELLAFGSGSDSGITYLPRAKVMWCGPRWIPVDGPHPFRAEGEAGTLERPHPGQRPANVQALQDVEVTQLPERQVRQVGAAAGSVKAGLNHVTLAPGAPGAEPHCHSLEEELFYVLDGSGTLALDDALYPLRAGDVVARPPGRVTAHSIRAGQNGIIYLAYGTREPGDIVHYPQQGRIRLRGLGVTLDVPPS